MRALCNTKYMSSKIKIQHSHFNPFVFKTIRLRMTFCAAYHRRKRILKMAAGCRRKHAPPSLVLSQLSAPAGQLRTMRTSCGRSAASRRLFPCEQGVKADGRFHYRNVSTLPSLFISAVKSHQVLDFTAYPALRPRPRPHLHLHLRLHLHLPSAPRQRGESSTNQGGGTIAESLQPRARHNGGP